MKQKELLSMTLQRTRRFFNGRDIEDMFQALCYAMGDALRMGEDVILPGVGRLMVEKRPEGSAMRVKIVFIAGSYLEHTVEGRNY